MGRLELEMVAEQLTQAWNAHDAAALCAFYALDADFVDADGAMVQGRTAIFAHHRRRFETIFARSTLTVNAVKVRAFARGAALMYGVWSMRGHRDPRAQWMPVRTGSLLLLFTKRTGVWQITLALSTALPVTPP